VGSIRVKSVLTTALAAALALLWLHAAVAQGGPAGYGKPMLCAACHKALNKDMVARFLETKHAKAQPTKDMAPVDIYRRCVGFNAADNTYLEAGVGCQACHGPGQAHVGAKTENKKATISRADQLKTSNQKLSVCGRCHGTYTVKGQPFAADFKPGDDLFALEGLQLTDTTETGPFTRLNQFMKSKHKDNDVTCLTCHTSHEAMTGEGQLRKPVPDLCLQCHAQAHQCKLPQDKWPAGSTCATCHMPDKRHDFAAKK